MTVSLWSENSILPNLPVEPLGADVSAQLSLFSFRFSVREPKSEKFSQMTPVNFHFSLLSHDKGQSKFKACAEDHVITNVEYVNY